MPRWTENHQEQVKMAGFADFVHDYATKPIVVTLFDGRRLAGTFYSSVAGNNAGEGGWAYYAGFTLETDTGSWDVDYLDVADVIFSAN